MARVDKKTRRMKGTTLVIILTVVAVLAVGLTIASVYINASSTKTASMIGILTLYSSGVGSASYNVTLVAKNGVGTLNLTQTSGSADLVGQHSYPLTDVLISPTNITMTISGTNVSLGWITTAQIWSGLNSSYAAASGVSNTKLWRDLNSSYAAASGPETPANVTIGDFGPSVLQLPSGFNMLIAVTIPQPSNTIPFIIAPILSEGMAWGRP